MHDPYVAPSSPEDPMVTVKYMDYGDLADLPRSQLRQMRTDFFSMPFQAVEVKLANVVPINARTHGYDFASETANDLYALTEGKVSEKES